MADGQLVNRQVDQHSVDRLQAIYEKRLIPAEKKPFLIDLEKCAGPLLAVDSGQYILDVASQIASLGLGFNAGAMFGSAQFQETWTGCPRTPSIVAVRKAFLDLMQRITGWSDMRMQLCNSGAEANETALGMSFRNRVNREAKKVIAFEGSFHGRMMVVLASTWNVKKREPFAWDGFETSYAPYPAMIGDNVSNPALPDDWNQVWSASDELDATKIRKKFSGNDPLMDAEVESLLTVRKLLETKQHYAVLIEPMQCEGGDRYSSARFHNGLANLADAFQVPLIYDEIQTGFGLGGDFFWHQKFDLRDAHGQPRYPDHVVLAKKAQVGAVLSHQDCPFAEQFNTASLTRGFIHASMIDQFREEIESLANRARKELEKLIQLYGDRISNPRVCGLSFAFDFDDPETLKQFVQHRFEFGLLFYPAGDRAARFRFNLAFRGDLVDLAWQQIHAALKHTLENDPARSEKTLPEPVAVSVPETDSYFDFHKRFISAKLKSLQQHAPLSGGARAFISDALSMLGIEGQIVFLNPNNWSTYRQQVWDLQGVIYEPLRQTPIEKFDRLIEARHAIAIAVLQDEKIIGMAFAAPPVNFPEEGGLKEDPFFNDPNTVYMLDLTVVPQYRGKLGRVMKQALCLAAQSMGLQAVQGRNRDRMARGMWAINLSLGSFCTRILKDSYADEHPFRDCLMYRCPLGWNDEPIYMSNAVHQPLDSSDLTEEFCHEFLPAVTNKLTLSNFVTHDYLRQLERVLQLLPAELQHAYTGSGMSECVDKLVKTLWLRRNPRRRMVVLGDSFFGHGSFLSRSLSGLDDCLFESTRIPASEQMMAALEKEIESDQALAVFLEPLGCLTGVRFSAEQLQAISELCQKYKTPLVSHDSAGIFHRYNADHFFPSSVEGFQPDAGMVLLGGQMAICFMKQEFFDETPLRFISTWDGDAFSLAQFDHAVTQASRLDMPGLYESFEICLKSRLAAEGVTDYSLAGGVGWFKGDINPALAEMFRHAGNQVYISNPSVAAIQKFMTISNSKKSARSKSRKRANSEIKKK